MPLSIPTKFQPPNQLGSAISDRLIYYLAGELNTGERDKMGTQDTNIAVSLISYS